MRPNAGVTMLDHQPGCLKEYFLKGTQVMDYFEYGPITVENPSNKITYACLTFSGPAKLEDENIAAPLDLNN